MSVTLYERFLQAAERFPERPALVVEGRTIAYQSLSQWARSIAATLQARRTDDGPPLSCVLGQRSAASFAGLLGILCSGHGYVPMLPTYPPSRLAWMIDRCQSRTLLVDGNGVRSLPQVLEQVSGLLTVVLLDGEVDPELRSRFDQHTLLGPSDLIEPGQWSPPSVTADDIAYLLFTSGSTGQPKGVMVANRNIARFLDVVIERYGLEHTDRFSHMFDVTFDLSLFDLFGAWTTGGCLCCPDPRQRMLPANYVVDSELTVWFSVPSTALLMKETRTLRPGAFPDLRWALFCGEALTVPVAEAFAKAAPGAVVENLYGPTEVTLACTVHRFDPERDAEAENSVVPIGRPYPGMQALVVDPDGHEVAPGEAGELVMAGPQVAIGYWRDPERTAAAFTQLPRRDETFYRTGDRVRRPHGDGPITFLGRLDSQIKIRGYRVELGEVEAAIRDEAGVSSAVALGWPPAASGGAHGIVGFIDDASVDVTALRKRLSKRLPVYMLPKRFIVVGDFPLNQNGKIDRNALKAQLQAES